MLVPCDTEATVSIIFVDAEFTISPAAFDLGPFDSNNNCIGGLTGVDGLGGEHLHLARPYSKGTHIQQDSGLLVTASCKTFTPYSTLEITKSVLPLWLDSCVE